jgi:hypothetical protein
MGRFADTLKEQHGELGLYSKSAISESLTRFVRELRSLDWLREAGAAPETLAETASPDGGLDNERPPIQPLRDAQRVDHGMRRLATVHQALRASYAAKMEGAYLPLPTTENPDDWARDEGHWMRPDGTLCPE